MQKHLWLSKELWNDMLEFTIDVYDNHQKFPTTRSLREMVKNSGLYSQTGQELVDRLVDALHRKIKMKKRGEKGGFPRFKSFDRIKSLAYPQSGFSLSDKKIKVTPFGEIKIKKHREIHGTIKTLTLKRESTGKWFAILTAEAEVRPVPMKEGEAVGVDLGLMTFATLSNGEGLKKPKHMRIYEEKLASAQRDLSKKKLHGKNRRKVKINVGRICQKVASTRRNWLHKTANDLLSRYSLIAFEDLDVQGIAEEHGKGVSDAGWSIFTDILSYKAESAGIKVVFVNPKNTSKDCSRCGTCVPKELWERQHNCPSCGLSMDRDLNAAINILNRATGGTPGSNACGDVSLETSMKQEAHGFSHG
jgi:putative transposase